MRCAPCVPRRWQVFDGLCFRLGNTRNPNVRNPFLAIDIEGDGGKKRLNQIGTNGPEDLPVRPSMLTAIESDQRVALLLAGHFVNDRAPHAVALMYWSRPPIKAGETHAVQSGVAKISVVNLPRCKGFAVPGRRQRIELAGTAPAAIAVSHFFTCDPPFDFRRLAHISSP